jgi:hypothetical protein
LDRYRYDVCPRVDSNLFEDAVNDDAEKPKQETTTPSKVEYREGLEDSLLQKLREVCPEAYKTIEASVKQVFQEHRIQ